MEGDIESLRENYKRFSDEKLAKMATEEAGSLTPQAIRVMLEEIKRRELPYGLVEAIDAQTRELTTEEFTTYCEFIRDQPCPVCGSTEQKLNAVIRARVIGVLFFTSADKDIKIACPTCLIKTLNEALLITGLAGWWSRGGLFRTIPYFITSLRMKKQARLDIPSPTLQGFVTEKVGVIEANKNNLPRLEVLIKYGH